MFTTPEIGTVGLTEARGARSGCADVDIYKANFRPMKATLSGSGERMIMKLVVDGATDRVRRRATSSAKDAAEMIQLARHRDEDGRDQGRFRRHHGGAPDRRRGTGDHAHARFARIERAGAATVGAAQKPG